MNILEALEKYATASVWSPYWVGIGIGILSWFAFLLSNKAIGASSAFSKTAGMIEEAIRGPKVQEKLYYRENPPKIDWGWMLVLGLFVGAMAAAWLSGEIKWEWMPEMWKNTFGSSVLLRSTFALFGGICIGIGARWGCGCTSGHGISGALQLVLSSWIAVLGFFAGGVVVAMCMYRLF
jgi:hypothetical protein